MYICDELFTHYSLGGGQLTLVQRATKTFTTHYTEIVCIKASSEADAWREGRREQPPSTTLALAKGGKLILLYILLSWVRGGAQIVCGEIRKKKNSSKRSVKNFCCFSSRTLEAWNLRDWLNGWWWWRSWRAMMQKGIDACVLSVLLGLWPTAPPAAGPHPPAAAREHFITYTTSFEAARWGRVYDIVREAHRGRKQQPGGRYVWRVTSHTFYNYKRTKTSKHAMFSSFLAWNHWGKNSMKKIVTFCIIFFKKNFQILLH